MSRTVSSATVATLFAFCLSVSLGVPFASPVTAQIDMSLNGVNIAPGAVIPGQYIVLLKEDAALRVNDVLARHGVRSGQLFERLGGFSGILNDATLQKLRADPEVAMVEPDYEVYAFSHNSTPSQTLPTGINRMDADLSATANINGSDQRVDVDVAVIDTGVIKNHADLNVVTQVNFSRDLSKDDRNGHGTHVAGTIGALDNSIGVVGVAPGARIWSVKVLDSRGSGAMSDIIKGIDYVTANAGKIEVANMSLGCECQSAALDAAISRSVAAGVVYAVAAGNSGKNAQTFSPANHPEVITVSAIADYNGLPGGGAKYTCYNDQDDTLANFSNFGTAVEIAAPGVCITSTWKDGKYSTISGTSMASPHVAGAAALFIAKNGKPTNAGGVAAVTTALKNQGFVNGYTGDPDGFIEPLLNAANL